MISRERLRQLLERAGVSFQRTKTWRKSNDPAKEAKLDRIEEVITRFPNGHLPVRRVRPVGDPPDRRCCWAAQRHPQRLRAHHHKRCGVRQFHACWRAPFPPTGRRSTRVLTPPNRVDDLRSWRPGPTASRHHLPRLGDLQDTSIPAARTKQVPARSSPPVGRTPPGVAPGAQTHDGGGEERGVPTRLQLSSPSILGSRCCAGGPTAAT